MYADSFIKLYTSVKWKESKKPNFVYVQIINLINCSNMRNTISGVAR